MPLINALQKILCKFSDKNSNMDCKLIAYALVNIIHNALHEK